MFYYNVQSPSLHLKKGDFQGLISTKNSGAETVKKKKEKRKERNIIEALYRPIWITALSHLYQAKKPIHVCI